MQPAFHIFLLAALAVAMVTSAPLTNQEKLVNVEQTGKTVDRAKRADEEIVFGNQQNKARVVSKKSDISNILAPPVPTGERDQGSRVIVHKGVPVREDLAARAEAASGSVSEHNEKMKEAVEAAIQSVAEAEKVEEAEATGQETGVVQSDEKISKQLVDEDIEDSEHGTGEISDAVEEKVTEDNEDEKIRNLEKGVDEAVRFEGGSNSDDGDDDDSSPGSKGDGVEAFLLEKQNEAGDSRLDRDREALFYEDRMRDYLMSLADKQNLPSIHPFISRFRRSLHHYRNTHTPRKGQRGRRIKRDLLDDSYYTPYELQTSLYTPEDIKDALLNNPDEPSSLSEEEVDYLNRKLEDYLTNNYEPEEEQRDEDEESPVDSYLNGYDEPANEPYTPYDIYSEDNGPAFSSPYDVRYPYDPLTFESYQNYVKRGMIDYYPQEEEKRYFFPFSKEPETHWGAFVPEKRDYGEAIQRLQRLAMALSDNPGPYYREMLEEYRKK